MRLASQAAQKAEQDRQARPSRAAGGAARQR